MSDAIWIHGRAEADDASDAPALLVDIELRWPSIDEPIRQRRVPRFAIVTDDGARVLVDCGERTVIAPPRDAAGPWRELAEHPTRPTTSRTIHPDGAVELAGAWLLAGERVAVHGVATEHGFVADTGGPRDAPRQRIAAMRAIAIGIGDDGQAAAEAALRRRRRVRWMQAAVVDGVAWIQAFWASATRMALLSAGVAAALAALGAYGGAIVAGLLALLWGWAASPLRTFPGGADPQDGPDKPRLYAALTTMASAMSAPMAAVFGGMDGDRRNADALLSCTVGFIAAMILVTVLRVMLARPRVEPGFQLELPASALRRAVLVVGLAASTVGPILLMVRAYDLSHKDR